MKSPDWLDDAACKGTPTKWWFPDTGHQTPPEAKALCRTCPVRDECLAEALAHGSYGDYGYFAGTTAEQRRRIRNPRPNIDPIRHGTYAGYAQHRRRGIPPCDACREARNTYQSHRSAS